jgi:hypothetical protein
MGDSHECNGGDRYVRCCLLPVGLLKYLCLLDDLGLSYQLELRRKHLLKMCATWQVSLTGVSQGCSDYWGPSAQELAAARIDLISSNVVEVEAQVFDIDFEDGVDPALVAVLDTTDEVDGFRGVVDD